MNDAFFLGGVAKSRILKVMRPHLFFDDQESHLTGAAEFTAGVHIPYGAANENNNPGLKTDIAFPTSTSPVLEQAASEVLTPPI